MKLVTMATASVSSDPLLKLKGDIRAVLDQAHFNLTNSSRCQGIQEFGRRLLIACDAPEQTAILLRFAQQIEGELDDILKSCSTCKLLCNKREKAWSRFHAFRCSKLIVLWKDFLTNIHVSGIYTILIQSVVQDMFEAKLKGYFHCPQQNSLDVLSEVISEDEKNVIMYACGYVPGQLINKYKKRHGCKYASFVQCLLHMAVGAFEDSFYDYARRWFDSINRGGAFEVDDMAFEFFLTVEKKIRVYLRSLHDSCQHNHATVIDDLTSDQDILYHWSTVSIDLSEAESLELLRDIVHLWLNIRGFSVVGTWNEQYKRLNNETMKSQPGLRKSLKKKAANSTSQPDPSKTANTNQVEELCTTEEEADALISMIEECYNEQ